ncbi:hypothetical protein QJS04_geneDACA006185 [Acorus gramineus]|uniref:Protein tweety homolog n=1 Tax=Acorus gramineus TaxID=55184 RepID=A0AAV9B2J7_ACOGR|nr:hypothetical protein QJS04_geneDACA006185 [Acorus gramineus]
MLLGDNSSPTSLNLSRTDRVDPLNHLRRYRGGYDITNKHYWSSTIFTGIYGYSIAVLCLLIGILYFTILLIKKCCSDNKKKSHFKRFPCSKHFCFWPIAVAAFLTLLVIVVSGVALGGSTRVHSRANSIKNIVISTANEASGTMQNITGAVKGMQDNAGQIYNRLQDSGKLNSTIERINDEASDIERKAKKDARAINKGLKIVYATSVIVVSLNLIAALSSLVCRLLRMRRAFKILLILCWLLTSLCWVHFGLYFFIDRFAGDSCAALEEYKVDPRNSSFSSILPCNNLGSVKSILVDTREGLHDLIDQNLLNTFPSMESLVNCEIVKNAFSEILDDQCKPVKRDVRMTWASMAVLSTIMVLLILMWVIQFHYDDGLRSSDRSVKPDASTAKESGISDEGMENMAEP